jgi:spore coat protein U-like protein
MAVTATVSNNCTISTNPVAFGSYDPIVAQASASLDGAGSVVIACTKGAVTTVALDAGANSSAGARRLAAGSSYINYQLYSDSNRSTAWGSDAGSTVAPGAAPSKAARTLTVYGRITGGQDVPAGSYTDTITATINF